MILTANNKTVNLTLLFRMYSHPGLNIAAGYNKVARETNFNFFF